MSSPKKIKLNDLVKSSAASALLKLVLTYKDSVFIKLAAAAN